VSVPRAYIRASFPEHGAGAQSSPINRVRLPLGPGASPLSCRMPAGPRRRAALRSGQLAQWQRPISASHPTVASQAAVSALTDPGGSEVESTKALAVVTRYPGSPVMFTPVTRMVMSIAVSAVPTRDRSNARWRLLRRGALPGGELRRRIRPISLPSGRCSREYGAWLEGAVTWALNF
jgi:hypothetical protein